MKMLYKLSAVVLMGAALFASCKKQVLDINTDPNNPTTSVATAELVLPAALQTTATVMNNPTADSRFAFAGIWMGHIAYSGNYAISTENLSYNITTNFASGAFGSLFDNINDYDFVESKGIQQGNKFYEAVGKLMKAYCFQVLVDLYGNIPYSEALKGTVVSRPKYDDAKTIYESLGQKMDTSITLLKTLSDNGATITGDVMFKGDASKWLQFANTVKLRLLLRQSERADRQSYIQTEKAKFGAGTIFLATNATINPGYLNSASKTNPFWGSNINTSGTYTQDFYRGGQYAISFFLNNSDPRVGKFYKPIAGSTTVYQGNYFGDQGMVNSKTSEIGTGVLKSYDQASVLMLAAESYFIQSEAVVRGWISGDAKTLYQKGVEASFTYLGLTAANAQTYYTQTGNNQVNWDAAASTADKIALIIRQKWAAEPFINELEPYNEYRRLKLPADVPLSKSQYSTGKLPGRLLYPQREYDVNSTNVPTAAATDKVWWMP